MSKVVDVRDYLNALISTELPTYVKLSDSYQTADNASIMLTKGYSIGFSQGENVSNEWCQGSIRIERQFQIVLTNIYTPSLDADYRDGLENALMDDQFALVAAIERDVTLTGHAINSRYVFDNGMEYLIDNEKQFIIVVITISVTYEEST